MNIADSRRPSFLDPRPPTKFRIQRSPPAAQANLSRGLPLALSVLPRALPPILSTFGPGCKTCVIAVDDRHGLKTPWHCLNYCTLYVWLHPSLFCSTRERKREKEKATASPPSSQKKRLPMHCNSNGPAKESVWSGVYFYLILFNLALLTAIWSSTLSVYQARQ